jgi:hypothetical protein
MRDVTAVKVPQLIAHFCRAGRLCITLKSSTCKEHDTAEFPAHQVQHTAALNVVILCCLVIVHLLSGKDKPAAR